MKAGEVIIMAPTQGNAAALCDVLAKSGIATWPCTNWHEFSARLAADPGAALFTEEVLVPQVMEQLTSALLAQPPWSDLPILILATTDGSGFESSPALAALRRVGSITVLERPVRVLTLVTALDSALRARARQHELKELLERERVSREQAEYASRIRDDFLATVSHELRTPLSALLVWSRMLATGKVSEKDFPRAVSAIEQSAEAQSKLVEDLLDAARMLTGKLQLEFAEADFATIAASAVDILRPAAELKGIRLETALALQGATVLVDPLRIRQVVWNLVSNAVKFTPAGGTVTVTLRRAGRHFRLTVEDDGIGISRGFLPHVFDRFRQADPSESRRHGGLGLGLAIVRQLVELHGGTVTAESAGKGKGATFTVVLPPAPADSAGARRKKRRRPVGRTLEHVRVMLVEDDDDMRAALSMLLESSGAQVLAISSATRAIAALEKGADPHVLVSDIAMPGENGYQLLSRLRAMGRTIPAAAITALARPQDRVRALASGFQAHLTKPVEPAELVSTVAKLAAASRAPATTASRRESGRGR